MATSGSTYDADDLRIMRKLIQSFENMDNLVIEMAQGYRDLTTPPGLTSRVLGLFGQTQLAGDVLEDALHTLQAAREGYLNSNYDMQSMLAYTARTSELAPTWHLVTASILKLKNTQVANSPETTYWSLIYRRLERAGMVAWESVLPVSSIFSRGEDGEGQGGAHVLNAIIDKFAALDDVLDVWHLEFGHDDQRQRFSDELRDTLFALIQYFSIRGRYAPLPSTEQIQVLKAEIRHRRNIQQASNEAEMASPDPPIQTFDTVTVPGSTDLSWREWILAPGTITACVSIITLLSAIPGYIAWRYATHKHGTVHDAGFWFLIQGSMMQLLGLLTMVIPLVGNRRLLTRQWFWTWGFIGTSFGCIVAAVPTYLFYTTEFSSTLAFIASATQGFVILQTVLIVKSPSAEKVKVK